MYPRIYAIIFVETNYIIYIWLCVYVDVDVLFHVVPIQMKKQCTAPSLLYLRHPKTFGRTSSKGSTREGSMIRHGSTPLYPQETMGSLAMFGQNWCDFLKGWLQDDSRSSGQVDILTLKRREI